MERPDETRKEAQRTYNARNPLLFTIPNPFDDSLRKKKGWYEEVKKMEEMIKVVRERITLIAERQKHNRRVMKAIREYCFNKRKKTPRQLS